MSAKIAVLAGHVADQIAAGEVVERPASVVKELVENALDAGARAVRVELEDGGKTLIRVSDDGEGMPREDAILALQRHATSKIRDAADLIGVASFGFRGEALPAIASVSRFELETSADGAHGTRLRVTGSRREAVEDAVRQRGTTITVRGLFFNTPARRKFLRAAATETRAAAEALTVLALTRPEVAFTLTSDGRPLLDLAVAARAIDRIDALWGRELADSLLPISHRAGPLEVTGFAQRPSQAKPAGRKGYVFVRGRPIRDPFIVRAAEAGYRSAIHPGDRPSLVLFLDLPGDAVDVNVHPAKLEVRFRDKFFVEKVVEEAVRSALVPLAAAAPLGAGSQVSGVGGGAGGGPWVGLKEEIPGGVPLELFSGESPTPDARHPTPSLLQVFDTYILFQTNGGVAIVDQHSAHERVLYEQVMRRGPPRAAAARRLRARAVLGTHRRGPHGAKPAPALRCRALPAGARRGSRGRSLRGVAEPARALRGHVRLPGGHQGGAQARPRVDAPAAGQAPQRHPAGARRARSADHSPAAQGRVGATVWAGLSAQSSPFSWVLPASARPPWRWPWRRPSRSR